MIVQSKLRHIEFYGNLKAICGDHLDMYINSISELIRCLCLQVKNFKSTFRSGEYYIFTDDYQLDNEAETAYDLGDTKTIKIVPIAVGSKNQGLTKVLLGIACIGIGFAAAGAVNAAGTATHMALGISQATWTTLGAGFLLSGIGQMISASPAAESNEDVDERTSYMWSSALNIAEEGNVMPLAYGKPWCGSLVISSGLDCDDVEISLAKPSNLSVSVSYGYRVNVSWSAVSGASEYIVRYGTADCTWDNYISSYTISGTSCTKDIYDYGTFRLMIRARNGSLYSDVVYTNFNVTYSYDDSDDSGGDSGNDDRD